MLFSKSSLAALAASTSCVIRAKAMNFMVIQPDDMLFYKEWAPPAPLPPWTNYPVDEYPGLSDLPNINKLRDEGLEMTQAYAASPKCGTSRFSTITGRYASRSATSRSNSLGEADPADASIPNTKLRDVGSVDDGNDCSVSNIAQVFSSNNYTTGMVGKWHLSRANQLGTLDAIKQEIVSCGFQDVEAMYPENIDVSSPSGWWSDEWSHNMEYVAYKAIEFIEDNQNKSWFLYVNPTAPHSPDIDEAFLQDCLVTPDGDLTTLSVIGMTAEFNDSCVDYRANVTARAQSSSNADLGSIWVDDAIGAIYKALERTGQLADTMIIFQLDHGKEEKDRIWEGGLRIPQFVHYPTGLGTQNRTFHGLVSTIDIGPTMLDFAGIGQSSPGWYDMDGKSWKTAINNDVVGDDWKANRCLFFESSRNRAVRCGCDKYMLLDGSSDEKATAVSNGWWSSNEVLVSLCDSNDEYINADENTAIASPEISDLTSTNQVRADELATLLQCHLDKTDADVTPLYQECFLSSTSQPTTQPTVTPPTATPGPPQNTAYFPLDGEFLSGDTVDISATVLDDNLRTVNFNVRFPDGSTLGFTNGGGTQVSSFGDSSTWEYALATTQKGKYGFKFEMKDPSNSVGVPSTDWIEFWVVDTSEDLLNAARDEIETLINDDSENLAAKFVRLGFHDCVGGCDGCVDLTNPDNFGLLYPIEKLQPVVAMFEQASFGVSRADIWALAALEGARGAQASGDPDNRNFLMNWIGRKNCEDVNTVCLNENLFDHGCTEDRGPHRDLPSPHLDTHELLAFFLNEFGFNTRDTVAIMGAHTLGTLSRANSGFHGPNGWLGNTNRLDNLYYDALVGGVEADFAPSTYNLDNLINAANWDQEFYDNTGFGTENRWQWERGSPNHFVMVNSDIALVRDLSGGLILNEGEVQCEFRCGNGGSSCNRCPHAALTIDIAAEYKHDNAGFLEDFESAFTTMLVNGYDTIAGCLPTEVCTLQIVTRRGRNLRSGSP